LIGNVLIDCGVPFAKIKEHLYDVKYLLLTHVHSDHIRPSTLDAIKKLFPKIIIIGNHEVHQLYEVNIIANAGFPVVTDDYTFTPFLCPHDVLTYGFTWEVEGQSIIYATDTTTLENAPNLKYDYFFIESNHCEKKVEAILENPNRYGYNAYAGAKRHLSTQQARTFYFTHRRSRESQLIELHRSSRFY
jgi:phosphoribosyl 1,2-cyclic phosphodiesterase